MKNRKTAESADLMSRKIYSICYTALEPIAALHDALYTARSRYYQQGKAVRIHEKGIFDGVHGTVRGKLSRHSLRWEKQIAKRPVELAFRQGPNQGIERRNLEGVLLSRTYYGRDLHWIRTDYYAPTDSLRVKISFKPDDTRDAVLRYEYNYSTGKTKETVLFPVAYSYQTAEQNLQNAACGETLLLIADETGEHAYCPRAEQQKRIHFLKENRDASVMLTMGWEVRDGDISAAPEQDMPVPVFSTLHEAAALPEALADSTENPEPPAESPVEIEETLEDGPELFFEISPATPFIDLLLGLDLADPEETETLPAEEPAHETDVEPEDEPAAEPSEETEAPADNTTPEAPAEPKPQPTPLEQLGVTEAEARRLQTVLSKLLQTPVPQPDDQPDTVPEPLETVSQKALARNGEVTQYTGALQDGQRTGFGKTETANGITLYEGEYQNDQRSGFGAHHYRSGAISYVGQFDNDQRSGFGVSFRENDHALHVSRWEDGAPVGYATLFDPLGNMKYAGKIVDGKKQGVGVTVDSDTDTVLVKKYKDNEPTGECALFDGDGNLLYTGGWKDGMRHGHGTAFDTNGDVIYTGEWKDDQYLNGILYKKVQDADKA